jgi:class 3 adenylate cyclase
VQAAMSENNAMVPASRRIEFRVGINVGDIFGDGVNVAACLEGLAEPGGICISRVALTIATAAPSIPPYGIGQIPSVPNSGEIRSTPSPPRL